MIDLDAYELHPGEEKMFNDFIMNARNCILHIIGVNCYLRIYLYTYVNDHI